MGAVDRGVKGTGKAKGLWVGSEEHLGVRTGHTLQLRSTSRVGWVGAVGGE